MLVLLSSRADIGISVLIFVCRMISYPNYKFTFPIKALGMFAKRYGDPELL